MEINKCLSCGFYDDDFGCTCPPYDKWYACPYSSPLSEKDFEKE